MKILLWFIILLIALSVSHADETSPLVVWQQSRDLSVWQNGETQVFPVGDLIFPYLSPSGDLVALVRGDYPYPEYLSVIAIDGDNLRDFDVAYPRQVIWQSDEILWVNSYLPVTDEARLDLEPSTLLYQINLITGRITEWDIGAIFGLSISPEGGWMAMIVSGVYEQSDTEIQVFMTTDVPYPIDTQTILRFPTISGATHTDYLPDIQWITETTARVPIRQPDAVYAVGAELPLTTIWEFSVTGENRVLGDFPALFFASPQSSLDGESIAYLTYTQAEYRLVVTSADAQTIYHDLLLQTPPAQIPMTIPTAPLFAYVQDSTMMLIGRDMPPAEWFMAGGAFLGDIFIGSGGAVFLRLSGIETTLSYVRAGESVINEILKTSEYPFFDAKWD